jgi:hypothetical protein
VAERERDRRKKRRGEREKGDKQERNGRMRGKKGG